MAETCDQGFCSTCGQELLRTADDCWHPYNVPQPCPDGMRPGRDKFVDGWPPPHPTPEEPETPSEEPDYAKYARVILDTGGAVEIGGVRISRLNDNDTPLPDAAEPPADGYVSRNVYDYDEPEPPSDVREALATLVQEQFPVAGGGYSVVWEDLFPVADAILAALPALGYVRITGDDDQVERVVTAMFNVVGDGSQMQSESHWYDIARAVLTALRGGA